MRARSGRWYCHGHDGLVLHLYNVAAVYGLPALYLTCGKASEPVDTLSFILVPPPVGTTVLLLWFTW